MFKILNTRRQLSPAAFKLDAYQCDPVLDLAKMRVEIQWFNVLSAHAYLSKNVSNDPCRPLIQFCTMRSVGKNCWIPLFSTSCASPMNESMFFGFNTNPSFGSFLRRNGTRRLKFFNARSKSFVSIA